MHQVRCFGGVRGGMAPPGEAQDPVVHALGPQLHRLHPIGSQHPELILRHGVGPGGDPEGAEEAFLPVGLRRLQQSALRLLRHSGEAAPVKGQLRPLRLSPRLLQRPDHVLRPGRTKAARNRALIAENAVIRTAQMGDENGDDAVLRRHAFFSRKRS